MNYLSVENISKSYGEKTLFENISFSINKGQKVAFVAKNGIGKSTLLKIIAGKESSDGEAGSVYLAKDVTVGFLDQEPDLILSHTVREAIYDVDSETVVAIRDYELAMLETEKAEQLQSALNRMEELNAWDYEARIKTILSKFQINNLEQTVDSLSGGQQKRLALAQLLIREPDFLIIDEPTNHLDLEMIEWLEIFFSRQNLTLFMVTHDRYFLERVCNTIIELDRGEIYKYQGNYSMFLEKKAGRQENFTREVNTAKSMMRRELQWMRKQPKARGTKAKARVDAFYQLEKKATQEVDEGMVQLNIKTTRMGTKVLEMHNVVKQYDDLLLVDKFNYKFKRKDRVGVIGKNGVGKSTFLNLMMQLEKPDGGKVVKGETVQFGYYTQDGIKLDANKRVIDVVRDIAEFIPIDGKGRNITASMLLERFLFDADHQYTLVRILSGGERRRLYLLTILMTNPNFLILDEPTNDLDIMTLKILEEFLIEFKGCLVIVTHDRHFMDKLIDHLFVFEGDGKIRDFPGNYSQYRDWKLDQQQTANSAPTVVKEAPKPVVISEEPPKRRLNYNEQMEFKKLESEIPKLEKEKATLTNKFNDTDLTNEQMTELSVELGRVSNALEEKEDRWLELSEFA